MKKKILGGIAVLAIAVVAAFNVSINTQDSGMSLISLENVEALASGEASSTYYSSDLDDCGTGGSSVCSREHGW